jgi:hypothetical protein
MLGATYNPRQPASLPSNPPPVSPFEGEGMHAALSNRPSNMHTIAAHHHHPGCLSVTALAQALGLLASRPGGGLEPGADGMPRESGVVGADALEGELLQMESNQDCGCGTGGGSGVRDPGVPASLWLCLHRRSFMVKHCHPTSGVFTASV